MKYILNNIKYSVAKDTKQVRNHQEIEYTISYNTAIVHLVVMTFDKGDYYTHSCIINCKSTHPTWEYFDNGGTFGFGLISGGRDAVQSLIIKVLNDSLDNLDMRAHQNTFWGLDEDDINNLIRFVKFMEF